MSWNSRVVWTQGMFLQPHHFQQETRYLEHRADARTACISPYAWGFHELQLDAAALANGRLGLLRATGVFSDGTPFSMPGLDPLPAPLTIADEVKDELIALVLPLAREDQGEVDYGIDDSRGPARYDIVARPLRDTSRIHDEPEVIQIGRLRARLMRARDVGDGDIVLGVARVVQRRPDASVELEPDYIAPQVRIDASGPLAQWAGLIHGKLKQRADQLAETFQLGRSESQQHDFLLLQTLNRNEPIFAQHVAAPIAHPRELHRDCLALAGDLATLLREPRRAASYPAYRHDDLKASYAPLFQDLRDMLALVPESKVLRIELVEHKPGLHTATVHDLDLVRRGTFVLAVYAQLAPEQLLQRFTSQTKIGPPDRLRELVDRALPGVPLKYQQMVPSPLRHYADHHYFVLDQHHELWRRIETDGNFAMFVAGQFPGLELKFWAIRP